MTTLSILFDNKIDEAEVELSYLDVSTDLAGAWDTEFGGYEVDDIRYEISSININNMGWCSTLNEELKDTIEDIINASYTKELIELYNNKF